MVSEKLKTKEKILEVGEAFIIESGYANFSFRDIAQSVGIKSASVHYHYPTKGDLVAAVMRRYREEFSANLPDPCADTHDGKTLLNGFIEGFKGQMVGHRNMSLCTILTADKPVLPELVSTELAAFYDVLLVWLSKVFIKLDISSEQQAMFKASQLLASLHGASILVQGTDNEEHFDYVMSFWREAYLQ